jgi:hypothetical protein
MRVQHEYPCRYDSADSADPATDWCNCLRGESEKPATPKPKPPPPIPNPKPSGRPFKLPSEGPMPMSPHGVLISLLCLLCFLFGIATATFLFDMGVL